LSVGNLNALFIDLDQLILPAADILLKIWLKFFLGLAVFESFAHVGFDRIGQAVKLVKVFTVQYCCNLLIFITVPRRCFN
jgi:hypothetical protein